MAIWPPTSAPSSARSIASRPAYPTTICPSSGTSAKRCSSSKATSRRVPPTTSSGSPPPPAPPPAYKERPPALLGRLGRAVPDGVELGYHLCYGSPADQHLVMPK